MDAEVIFIIGAGRSGTTLLAGLMGMHPDAYKMDEKRYLWMYGNYWRSHDVRDEQDYAPRIGVFIRSYLEKESKRHQDCLLIEKTPSNCFRLGFINKVVPLSKYIHIIRDGRDVAYSSVKAFYGDKLADMNTVRSGRRSISNRFAYLFKRFPEFCNRFRELDLPPSGWLPYTLTKTKEICQVMGAKRAPVWGVRYPGIHEQRKAYPTLILAGIQWRESLTAAMYGFKRNIPQDHVFTVRYESLVNDPITKLGQIFSFAGLTHSQSFLEQCGKQVRSVPEPKWREKLYREEMNELLHHIGPMLRELAYLDS